MTNKIKLNLSTNKGNDNIVSDSILDTYFENSN